MTIGQVRRLAPAVLAGMALLAGVACDSGGPTSPTPPTPSLGAPGIDSPADGADVATVRPTLTVLNVVNPPAGVRTYEFQVAPSSAFSTLVVNQVGVPEGTGGKTAFTLGSDLTGDTRYYWRARAVQAGTAGPWSVTPSFRVVRGQGPLVRQLSARGAKPNEPSNFADLGETIAVTAVVEDPDTPADRLVYDWKATAGTFSGTGATVNWQAPTGVSTPGTATITLSVSDGPPATSNTTTATLVVNLHDSAREVAAMVTQFLTDFSTQADPARTVSNFTTSCPGRASELYDAERAARCYTMDSYSLGTPRVTINFGGVCEFRSRVADACSSVAVEWRTTTKRTDPDCLGGPIGTKNVARGTDWVTAVYERPRWWLCDSDFDGTTTSGALIKR
jgi:hypothetical protein